MISVSLLYRFALILFCIGLAYGLIGFTPSLSHSDPFSPQGRQYGPTTPGGYRVRVSPHATTMAHSQRRTIEVYVETPDSKPANGVVVRFRPSEGVVAQDHQETRYGLVTGHFAVSPGSDQPRTATIVVSVENVDITVFIDIVPAVFGR
jgi:hypothetical protein